METVHDCLQTPLISGLWQVTVSTDNTTSVCVWWTLSQQLSHASHFSQGGQKIILYFLDLGIDVWKQGLAIKMPDLLNFTIALELMLNNDG